MPTTVPRTPNANMSTGPPLADIDRSPTLLLAGMFAARRSGDAPLERIYMRRLGALGIYVTFAPATNCKSRTRKGVRE